jgi:oligopeptide/dipeptide ABC transporter ATP-binding protein
MQSDLLEHRPAAVGISHVETVLSVAGLGLTIAGRSAVRDVSLSVAAGRTLCLVGESGCGKSLTCLAVAGLLPPSIRATGSVMLAGQELLGLSDRALSAIRGRQVAMITQDPMAALNPVMQVGAQIAEAMTLHGKTHRAATAEARRLMERVGIADPASRLRAYPHELSGGMAQRVAIAMALACKPRLLIADEPTTALDVTIQAQILDLLRDTQREFGMALLLVTHDLGVVAEMADDVAVMYAGNVVERATVDALFENPAHPYTAGLMACVPKMEFAALPVPIPGTVPAPGAMPPGCAFAPRCQRADAACADRPALSPVARGHEAACFHPIPA